MSGPFAFCVSDRFYFILYLSFPFSLLGEKNPPHFPSTLLLSAGFHFAFVLISLHQQFLLSSPLFIILYNFFFPGLDPVREKKNSRRLQQIILLFF